MKQKRYKYYVCDKQTNGVWFTCDSFEEAMEWKEYAPVKAQEPSGKFYIRKELK